jgi:hypothetical protein
MRAPVPQPSTTHPPFGALWQPGPHPSAALAAPKIERLPANRTATKRFFNVSSMVEPPPDRPLEEEMGCGLRIRNSAIGRFFSDRERMNANPRAHCARVRLPLRLRSMNVASFVLWSCPIVAKTAIPTSGAGRIVEIAILFWDRPARIRNQKLFPHFREARTAVFTVEEIEYGGHDRTPSFKRYHQFPSYHVVWDAIRKVDHSPSLFPADFAT